MAPEGLLEEQAIEGAGSVADRCAEYEMVHERLEGAVRMAQTICRRGDAALPSPGSRRADLSSCVYKVPRRPFESARLDAELKLAGEYGLKNKHEIWRIALILSKIRRAARELLKLDEKDPKRLFEGNALIRRFVTFPHYPHRRRLTSLTSPLRLDSPPPHLVPTSSLSRPSLSLSLSLAQSHPHRCPRRDPHASRLRSRP